MDHLVGQCILQMPLIFHFICAKQNPIFRIKAPCFPVGTSTTIDIMARQITAQLPDAVTHIPDNWAFS